MSGGYVMVPSWLLDLEPSGTDLLVYCRLAGYGKFDTSEGVYEECRPPLPKLAAKCRVSVSTVQRGLRWLRDHGAIEGTERTAADGSPLPTVYRVMFGNLTAPRVVSPVTPPPPTDETTPGSTDDTTLVAPVTTEQEPSTQNPSTQSSEQPSATRRRKPKDSEPPDPRVGQLVADWIDYCGAQNVKLTPQAKGRYAAKIKELVGAGFEVNLIKRALAQMIKRRKEAYPGLLDSFVIEVQGGTPPVPTSGAPVGSGRQPFRTADEKRTEARARERAILELIDDIRENLPSYNPLDPEQARAVRREAERRYEQSLQVDESTAGMGVPYSGNRQTDPVDAEWYENHPSSTPPKELTSHANG